MHDHEFEKQVHQKMTEFSLPPSESVWKEVEKRLHTKEKQRRWAVLLPLLLLSLGFGAYLLYDVFSPIATSPETVQLEQAAKDQRPPAPVNTPDAPASQQKVDGSAPAAQGSATKEEPSPNTETASASVLPQENRRISPKQIESNRPLTEQVTSAPDRNKSRVPAQGRLRKSSKNTDQGLPGQDRLPEPAPAVSKETSGIVKGGLKPADDMLASDHATDPGDPGPARVSFIMPAEDINTMLAISDQPLKTVVTMVKLSTSSGWEWGISFEGGRASVTNSLGKTIFRGGPMASNFMGGNLVSLSESNTEPGFGFSSGVFFNKKLSRRTALSLGLNYTLLTTSIKVGSRIDSFALVQQAMPMDQKADGVYYRSGNSESYTNRYHFIELPVAFRVQLNKRPAFPFYWNAGVSVSRLIGGNALHYNNSANIYFKDNDLINRTQVAVLTGLSMRFFAKRRFPLEAGPQLQYGLNKLLNKQISSDKHLMFAGLRANILLGKK